MGIEPTSEAWEARNKTQKAIDLEALSFPDDGLNWKLGGNGRQLQIMTALMDNLSDLLTHVDESDRLLLWLNGCK